MKVAIGADPNAFGLKDEIKKELEELGIEYKDFGSDDPIYANVAIDVAEAVSKGEYDRGILMCGTGIGVAIAANKVKGAYAAQVTDAYQAERAAKSNDANIITFGAQTIGHMNARSLVKIWMGSEWVPGGRSQPKVDRIYEYEKEPKTT